MSRTVKLADLVAEGSLIYGDGYRTKKAEHGRPGLPILRVAEVFDGGIRPQFKDFVSESYRTAMGSKVSQPGDVVLTTKGTVGRVTIMPATSDPFVYSPQLCFFRILKNSPLSPRYLLYWFKSNEFWAQAASRKSQTDMADYLNLADIGSLRLTLPDLAEQEKIASILSALDDKISVNDRIAECSLTLADAHFNRAVEGVPTGPETFGSIAQVGGGGTPSTKVPEYWDGNIAWATPSDVTALGAPYLFGTSRRITDAGLDNCASALYPAGSIFMTSRATIGAFAIPQVPMAVNQGFIVVVAPDEELGTWLFHEMRDRVDEMRSLANGSTFLELSRKNFKAMGVRLPTPTALKEFAAKAISLHQISAAVTAENATLIKLRDTLLPELMSGRLRVKDAEKVIEESV